MRWKVNAFSLKDAEFEVNEALRQKVVEEKRKRVHAFVCGDSDKLSLMDFTGLPKSRPATYNPYKSDTFVDTESGHPIHRAKNVIGLPKGRIFYVK